VLNGEDVSTLDGPLDGVLVQSLDQTSSLRSISLNGQGKTGTLVDQVAILKGPELDVKKSVLIGGSGGGLGMDRSIGANLHVVLAKAVLDIDNVAVRGTDEEVRVLGEALQLAGDSLFSGQERHIALVQCIELLLDLFGDNGLQCQPREMNLGKTP